LVEVCGSPSSMIHPKRRQKGPSCPPVKSCSASAVSMSKPTIPPFIHPPLFLCGYPRSARQQVLAFPRVEQFVVVGPKVLSAAVIRQSGDTNMVAFLPISGHWGGGEKVLRQECFRERIAHPFLVVHLRHQPLLGFAGHSQPHQVLLARAHREHRQVGADGGELHTP